jgi:hypothetical protein
LKIGRQYTGKDPVLPEKKAATVSDSQICRNLLAALVNIWQCSRLNVFLL